MKRLLLMTFTLALVVIGALGLYKLRFSDNLEIVEQNYKEELVFKGVKGATSMSFDDKDNYYLSTSSEVIKVNEKGKSEKIFSNDNFNICSLVWYKDKLYFVSNTSLYSYDLKSRKEKQLIGNIPNYGDYKNGKLMIKDGSLYLTIGAATNSGVVGEDNNWINKSNIYDLTPKPISLSGRTFGKNNGVPFVPYGTLITKGQTVPANSLGNASIIKINLSNNRQELYAWGIRNVEGIDFTSKGNIFAVVGGMEERGARPVIGDKDYIYEIKGGATWYGWPDYSGGDPVDSPRFRKEGKEKTYFALDNHPTSDPPAPLYQHNYVSSLKSLAIDKTGIIMEKDSMFIYDKEESNIFNITDEGGIIKVAKLNKSCSVVDLKINKDKLYVLEGTNGKVYSISKVKGGFHINLSKKNTFYILSLIMLVIIVLMIKFSISSKEKSSSSK